MRRDSLQRWLQGHCEGSAEVAGGVVLGTTPAGELDMVAEWPESGTLGVGLATVAKEAARRVKSLTLVPAVVQKDASHARVVALPLRVNEKIVGAAALAVRSSDAAVAKTLLDDLERVAPSIAQDLAQPVAEASSATDELRVRLQDIVVGAQTLPQAALNLVNHLAQAHQFDRVSVGLIDRDRLEVMAMSRGKSLDERQELVRGMADAMQEAADQKATAQYPVGLQDVPRIVQAHTRLAARSGTALCTVPLISGGRATGALCFERKGNTPLAAGDRVLCETVAQVVAPLLALKRQAESSVWVRLREGMRKAWLGRGVGTRRLMLAGALLALAALFFLPFTFRVGAPARVEGAVQRVLAAPMDGFLRQTRVRPGDAVKTGDVLVELADQELALEKRKWESELARHQNNFSFAMGRSDRAQFAINYARAAEAKAQLDLVESQLARAQVVAPIDGLVIQGDLTQVIGAPVKRGDTLLTLAPKDQYRIIVEVDERDIAHVRIGQRGRLALAAMPGETIHFSVQRITPVANVTRDGRNVFDVEARLEAGSVVPRHGLQGVAKIETERHALAWIVARRVVDWVRLTVWSWLP